MLVFKNILNTTLLNKCHYRELRGIARNLKLLEDVKKEQVETNGQAAFNLQKSNTEIQPKLCGIISSPLAPVDTENPPDLVPDFKPTFNLAAYVNKSESLQQLIKLGVDLSKIEKRKGLPEFVMKLNFEKDIKPYIIFLNDVGVPPETLGEFFTKNPLIFKEDIEDLQTRITYLKLKNFKADQISRIVTRNPFWLMFSNARIDRRLGLFQKAFGLKGYEVRLLAAKQPRLITYHLESIQKSIFCIKEEMGFNSDELKSLVLNKPRLWMIKSDDLIERFSYVHNTMKISHQQIVEFPEILTSREFRIKQRHEFLKLLGKAQYDPKRDMYVSLKSLIEGTDRDYVINVAKSDMETYNTFLRTL